VKSVYPDAADAIEWFEEKRVSLPEVSVFKPGAEVKLTLDYRNIKEASVQLYKVDLMKLYLREKSLSNITRVNLAGIQPQAGETVALGDGKDFAGKQKVMTLPVKEEGAYLAIVRGDDLFTSGLVVISPLTLEVKENAPEGSVRVNLTDVAKGGAVSDAEVKALANGANAVQSGTTDPRGVYEATGLKGVATIIVRQGTNRYAFHRGTQTLGTAPAPSMPAAQMKDPKPKGKVLDREEYLNNLNDMNRGLQEQQIRNWDEKRRLNNKGVEAKDVFKK
jgi:alpha-2-macroglobulin